MGRIGTLLKKGRIVIALVVAFAIGGGAGALAEHQRLKDKSNKSASTQTTTSPTSAPVAAAWFKTPTTQACPALKVWKAAGAASYVALLKKGAWSTTKATLLAQNTTATASLRTLLPMTTPAGRAGINFLVTSEGKVSDVVKHATSQADYGKAAKALASPRLTRSNAIMSRAANTCATTT
jgi:hypothetical protein